MENEALVFSQESGVDIPQQMREIQIFNREIKNLLERGDFQGITNLIQNSSIPQLSRNTSLRYDVECLKFYKSEKGIEDVPQVFQILKCIE